LFLNRGLRFGLSVGAIFLAGAYCARIDDPPLFQGRSFFGVLKVQERGMEDEFWYSRRLVHGTTLHGTQFMNHPRLRYEASTYYHRTGPVGLTFQAYNRIDRPFAVIGLGTGTMATYGLAEAKIDDETGRILRDENGRVQTTRHQKMTFYDIDPIVI